MQQSSTAHQQKSNIISGLFVQDLLVAAGMMVLIFGSILPVISLSSANVSFGMDRSHNFTDEMTLLAGEKMGFVGTSINDYLAGLNLSWQVVLTALTNQPNLLAVNTDQDLTGAVLGIQETQISQPLDRLSPWLKHPLPDTSARGAVLGELDQESDKYVVKPVPVDPEIIPRGEWGSELESLVTNPLVFEYKINDLFVDRVEFLVDGILVSVDDEQPYFLGGDQAGSPVGYNLEPGSYLVTARVYFVAAPDNYLEHSKLVKVTE